MTQIPGTHEAKNILSVETSIVSSVRKSLSHHCILANLKTVQVHKLITSLEQSWWHCGRNLKKNITSKIMSQVRGTAAHLTLHPP